ncbi:MAG: bifunctional 5,10-methylenetetrahydrofolate dehydrogenase/5,10-methenyltetrahydrofolate cyclohydrolase, partial [Patescibacteria group bacterium]
SRTFMEKKKKVAERLGMAAEIREEKADTTEEAEKIIGSIAKENFDGVVIQLPLPKNFDTQKVLDALPENQDIDILGTKAKESYRKGLTKRIPPVASAILEIFKEHRVDVAGRHITLLGKGRLVGEPVAFLFEKLGVRYDNFDINSSQEDMMNDLEKADIVISGIGKPHFIKPEMIKNGVVLIDAGTSESEGKLVGDVDPECAAKASFMTPVPNGVGPITIAVLFQNLC